MHTFRLLMRFGRNSQRHTTRSHCLTPRQSLFLNDESFCQTLTMHANCPAEIIFIRTYTFIFISIKCSHKSCTLHHNFFLLLCYRYISALRYNVNYRTVANCKRTSTLVLIFGSKNKTYRAISTKFRFARTCPFYIRET